MPELKVKSNYANRQTIYIKGQIITVSDQEARALMTDSPGSFAIVKMKPEKRAVGNGLDAAMDDALDAAMDDGLDAAMDDALNTATSPSITK